jgi:hypothetical protein
LNVGDFRHHFVFGFTELHNDGVNGFLGGHGEPFGSEREICDNQQGETANSEGGGLQNHGVTFLMASNSRSTARDHRASLAVQ